MLRLIVPVRVRVSRRERLNAGAPRLAAMAAGTWLSLRAYSQSVQCVKSSHAKQPSWWHGAQIYSRTTVHSEHLLLPTTPKWRCPASVGAHQTGGRLAERLDGEVACVTGGLLTDTPVAHTHDGIIHVDVLAAFSHKGASALVAPAPAQMTACAGAAAHVE